MATIESFYQWLIGLFQEGEHLEYEDIKYRMEDAGYGDVKAEDVYNAVNTMIDDGDVFTNEQTSTLEAYTGGNTVNQAAYVSSGDASSGGGSGAYSSAASAPVSSAAAPPPPPPLQADYYESDLEGALRHVMYVNNVTNNTYTEDNDYFSDDDTVIDSSVNQNIVAGGDVSQDFDTVTATGQGVAAGDDIKDSAIVTGEVEDSVVSGDDTNLEGSAVGDNNTILNDSDGAVLGDGSQSITDSHITDSNVLGPNATQAEQIAGGDAIQAQDSAVATGGGDAISDSQANTGDGDLINDSNANTGDGDFIQSEGSNVNTGEGNLVDADNSVASGEGDVQGINQSNVEAAAFGEGDASADDNIIDHSAGAAINTGEHGEAEGEFEETFEQQNVDIDHSAGIGVSDDGDAEGEFTEEIHVDLDVEHAEPVEEVLEH